MTDFDKISKKYDDLGLGGSVYAASTLKPSSSLNILKEYQKGVDVYGLSSRTWLANGHNDTVPYLQRLLYQRSSIHNSSINIISSLIFGSGLEFSPLTDYIGKGANGDYEIKETNLTNSEKERYLKQALVFNKNTGLSGYALKASSQCPLYGGYFGLRDYVLDSSANTKLRSLRVENYINMRLGVENEYIDNKFQSKMHYVSPDWTRAVGNKITKYSNARPKDVKVGSVFSIPVDNGMMQETRDSGIRSFFTGRMTDYRDHYATPNYESLDALSYIEIDYMLSQKDFRDLENGFALDHIIVRYRNRYDDATQEKKAKQKDIEMFKSYKGFDAENTMMMWVEPSILENGKVEAPETIKIITIPNNNNSERYDTLRDERSSKILSAHNIITGELIGLQGLKKSGFSSQSEYLITSLEHLYYAIVQPYQKIITEDIDNILLNAGIPVSSSFIANSVNYKKVSDVILQFAYGKDEIRKKNGDEVMSELVSNEISNRINKTKF